MIDPAPNPNDTDANELAGSPAPPEPVLETVERRAWWDGKAEGESPATPSATSAAMARPLTYLVK
jgi:hypothetical protein